jgi:hypothetical protein
VVVKVFSDNLHEAVGAIHLHSDYSDGLLSIPEIAQIANGKNLDYLMFSDHNTIEPKLKGLEGWYDRVFVIIGCELNDPEDRNHYLAFRINEEISQGLEAKDYVRLVKEMGGFGVIAHPAEKRKFSDAYPPYPWTEWDIDGFDGIEIWNQLSEWIEGVTRTNLPWRIMHPLKSVRYPVWETLERWDRLNTMKRVVGIGGIDVHAHRIKLFRFIPVVIYPYKVQFRSIRTHLLTKKPLCIDGNRLSFKEAEMEIFDSLSKGRCFIVNSSLGDGRNFRFWAESKKKSYPMGSRIRGVEELIYHAQTPLFSDIRLIRNGMEVMRIKGKEISYKTREKGVYRIEVFRRKRGWIYSNPIVIIK